MFQLVLLLTGAPTASTRATATMGRSAAPMMGNVNVHLAGRGSTALRVSHQTLRLTPVEDKVHTTRKQLSYCRPRTRIPSTWMFWLPYPETSWHLLFSNGLRVATFQVSCLCLITKGQIFIEGCAVSFSLLWPDSIYMGQIPYCLFQHKVRINGSNEKG